MNRVLALLLGLALPLGVLGAEAAVPPPLRLGLLVSGPTTGVEADWSPLVGELEARMGRGQEIWLRPLPPEALRAAVTRGDVEVVITNPVHYIEIRALHPLTGVVATLDMDPSHPATAFFGGVILRRMDATRWAHLEDFAGARIGYQDRGLLGGHVAPLKRLRDAGVPDSALRLRRVGDDYDAVVQAVLDGTIDAGFVRTGVLERWRRTGRPGSDELAVVGEMAVPGFPFLTSTPVYPEWAVVMLPHLDEARSRAFATALLAVPEDSPALANAHIERVLVPADYSGVEALLRDLRFPPFDGLPEEGLEEVWERYPLPLSLMAALGVGGCFVTLLLFGSRRRLKRSRAEAVEETQRLQDLLGAVRAGTWEWNVQTKELRVNRHWLEMLGYAPEDFDGISIALWRNLVHPQDLDATWLAVEAHLRGETPRYEAEFRMRHKAGHWVRMHDRGEIVVRDAEGEPLWMCGLHLQVDEDARTALPSRA